MNRFIKSIIFLLSIFSVLALTNTEVNAQQTVTLNIFNWGEYIDNSIIRDFEKEYPHIKINYETFDSNEAMYTKLVTGDANYDVVIPSEYMIERLINENRLIELDFNKIPNYQNIDPNIIEKLDEEFSNPSRNVVEINKYIVPYFWGTVGILYDKTKVKETVDSWNILWDETYKKEIFMYDSQRDSLMVALKKLGYSMNSTNEKELNEAKEQLIKQKPLVYAYVTDTIIQSMIQSEAALAVVYSGDAAFIMSENENMEFAIPKEGTNFWIDGMVIPKTSKNVEEAHLFINFMCRPEIALKNTEHIMYSSPVKSVFEQVIEEDWANNIAYNPYGVIDVFDGEIETEIFRHPGEFIKVYDNIWSEVLAPDVNYLIPIIIGGVIIVGIASYFFIKKRKKLY